MNPVMNKIFNNISELILLLMVSAMMIGNHVNYLYLGVAGLFIVLMLSQNRAIGIFMGILIMLISVYMVFALFSEFSEFSTVNKEAMILLGVGLFLICLSFSCAVLLLKKYAKISKSLF